MVDPWRSWVAWVIHGGHGCMRELGVTRECMWPVYGECDGFEGYEGYEGAMGRP